MIRWQKRRANEFPRWIFECLPAIGLSFLIHIHRNPRVLFIRNYSLMSEGVSSGLPECQFYVWRKMLDGTNTRKEVFTLLQPKVSTAFGKLSFNFVHKITRVRTLTQANKHVHSLFALSIPSSWNSSAKGVPWIPCFRCNFSSEANWNDTLTNKNALRRFTKRWKKDFR